MSKQTQTQHENSPISGSRYRNEVHIESLYNEFESLKSQIYGFEESSGLGSSRNHKEGVYKDKATFFLQASTIKKYELELASHLESIHKRRELEQSRKKQKKLAVQQRSSAKEKNRERNNEMSKVLSQYKSEHLVGNWGQSLSSTGNRANPDVSNNFQKSQALFYQLINDSSKTTQRVGRDQFVFDQLKNIFQKFSNSYLETMSRVEDTLKFFNQKLRCLELIFEQFSKIRKIQYQTRARNVRNEKNMMLDVQRIENLYRTETKALTQFYQRKNREIEWKCKETTMSMKNSIEDQLRVNNDAQKASLKSLLEKAKNVISTKEELIASLQEENEELRTQIVKLKGQLDKKDSELCYSSKTQKIQAEMAQISAIKKIVNYNPKDLAEQQEDDINFSELGSIKDTESLSEWDHSLDLQHSKIEKNTSKKGSFQMKQLPK